MGKTHKNAKGPAPQLRSRNTRSSKGRLLTETSSSTSQLTSQLSLLGLYAAPTIGDGNCLFRALSDQLYGSPSKHHELRQQICDHIAMYKSRYEPFVEDERGLEVHLRVMRENATYGGHMELSAFAHMTRRNVKVIQPGLVYIIEWNAGGWDDGSFRQSARTRDQSSPRRTARSSSKSVSPTKSKEVKEETRIKLGKGYYVYEEVSSDEEGETVNAKVEELEGKLQNGGPTVYVAYHDWEHFSSIRNLRGPHAGLPNVIETPPPSMEDSGQPITAKDRERERDRERKRERERKEKERKERKGKEKMVTEKEPESSSTLLKVKLRLPPSVSANANASSPVSITAVPPSSSSASSTSEAQPLYDPSSIPLPISRSASPFVGSSSIPLPISRSASPFVGSSSSLVTSSAASPLPSSSLANEVYPEDPSPHTHIYSPERLACGHRNPHAHILQTPRSQYRSPKRTFDESSASGAEEDAENSKRSRRRVGSAGWSGEGVDSVGKAVESKVVVDIVMNAEVDGKADEADTPFLSAPRSTSSSPLSLLASSVASSVSGASSEVEVDDDIESESQADEPDDDDEITAKLPSSPIIPDGLSKKARRKYLHMHFHHHAGEETLTQRQRKLLGVPKPRPTGGGADNVGDSNRSSGVSAGKIVIPGGRNGTGRLDVRGFRELKI